MDCTNIRKKGYIVCSSYQIIRTTEFQNSLYSTKLPNPDEFVRVSSQKKAYLPTRSPTSNQNQLV